MKKQTVKTKTKSKTATAVGLTLITMAGLAAAAGMVMSMPKLSVRLNRTVTSAAHVRGAEAEMLAVNFSSSTFFGGSLFVENLSFHVIADDDASFTTVENDITASDFISSCSLFNSSDALVSGPEAIGSGGLLAFEDLDIEVSRGRTVSYKVVCDFANVDTTSADDDIYALTMTSDSDLDVETASGSVLVGRNIDVGGSGDPGINPNGRNVAVVISNSGTLTATAASDMPSSTIILGSSTGVSMARYEFAATNEAFTVNKITLLNCVGYNEDEDCTDADEAAGSDNSAAAVRVSYTNSSGITETHTGYLTGNYVVFSGLDMYVPADERRDLTVTAETSSVSFSADSGDLIQLNFDTETADADFQAVGMDSAETINETDTGSPDSIAANDMVLRKTKPTIGLASGSPSGSSIPGRREAFRFNIAADSRGYVTVNELTFKLTSTDLSATNWNICDIIGGTTGLDESDFSLYDTSDLATELDEVDSDWRFLDDADTTALCTEGVDTVDYVILDLTTPDEVAAGSTVTYSLYMDTTGASAADDDSIRIDLPSDSEVATNGDVDPDGTIIWEDDCWTDDIDGTFIRSLPITGGTITY